MTQQIWKATDYSTAFRLWNAVPPPFLNQLLELSAGLELLLGNRLVNLPWPFLGAGQIASAFSILDEWEIPNNLIPIAGDFHDLLCLDTCTRNFEIVVVDDARNELARFADASDFFAAIRFQESSKVDTSGIIEEESWLGF